MPNEMINEAKKYKQFYKKSKSLLRGSYNEIIRSKDSRLGSKLNERGQTIYNLLESRGVHDDIIDFIDKCLFLDPEFRLKPEEGLHHAWFRDLI